MLEFYKATLDFLKTPYIWAAVVIATGILNFDQFIKILEICR